MPPTYKATFYFILFFYSTFCCITAHASISTRYRQSAIPINSYSVSIFCMCGSHTEYWPHCCYETFPSWKIRLASRIGCIGYDMSSDMIVSIFRSFAVIVFSVIFYFIFSLNLSQCGKAVVFGGKKGVWKLRDISWRWAAAHCVKRWLKTLTLNFAGCQWKENCCLHVLKACILLAQPN